MTGTPRDLPAAFADRYVIERELGHGATATVYLARDKTYGRPVAIKLLRSELADSLDGERFLREIQLTAQLHHPNILAVLDSGSLDGKLFVAFPYMDGGSLRDRLNAEKQLPVNDAVRIGVTIARALAHAHAKGLLHRDVKPENIVFGAGQPCLADFGIARALVIEPGERTTTTGVVRGTPAYMSPEQASAERELDGRSDQYSLACVLYEAIAGVPAFVGPTSQSVIAQRFAHAPRPISVYRPAVPRGVEAVLERALQLAPADRFVSAADFADALEAALADRPAVGGRLGSSRAAWARWAAILLVAATVVAAAAAMISRGLRSHDGASAIGDTTRVAVLPVEGPGQTRDATYDALLYAALSQWSGISLIDQFTIEDAVRRHGSGELGVRDAGDIASDAGASRYVRARITPVGDSVVLSAAIFYAHGVTPLYSATQVIPRGGNSSAAYERLAAALLLRGANAGTDARAYMTKSVPAMQAYAAGIAALSEWNLAAADSAFQSAIQFDTTFVRPVFWSAQVRAWANEPLAEWSSLAQRAAGAAARLSPRERALALALDALGQSEYARACARYAAMRDANPRDFAAWFGTGQCRDLDRVVVPDRASPTGWRFRSSYVDALAAYERALRLLSSSYRGFQRRSYEPLQRLFFTNAAITRSGIGTGPDAGRFLARATLEKDSLHFWPVPIQQMLSGQAPLNLAAARDAIEHNRRRFYEITRSWSASLPGSSGAKEAFAVGLDLVGDPAAVDTLRAAERIATSAAQQLRLAATEVFWIFKRGLPDDTSRLRRAGVLADSLLTHAPSSAENAEYLAPLAALLGRCEDAARFARAATRTDAHTAQTAFYVRQQANELSARISGGCITVHAAAAAAHGITLAVGGAARDRAIQAYTLLGPSVRLLFPPDPLLLADFAPTGDSYLLAERALLAHDTAAARAPIRKIEATRRAFGEPGPPDAFLTEVRILLASGDTSSALAVLGENLAAARQQPLTSFDTVELTVARAACMMRAMALYAELERAIDGATAERWRRAYTMIRPAAASSR